MRRIIIGVMGGSAVSHDVEDMAYHLGKHIAEEGWVLLNGGRRTGVMDASAQGAREGGGLTVGILPDDHLTDISPYIDIPIVTGIGSARNNINVLSSDVIVACEGQAGTISEIALALKAQKPVILMGFDLGDVFKEYQENGHLMRTDNVNETIRKVHQVLAKVLSE